MRLLVVEDDEDLARQLAGALRKAGYAVDVSHDGEDGHFLGETEPYDAVVLDLGLPVMDGATILKKWRAAGRNMPVLILTARGGWSAKVAGFDAGADDYVVKPFEIEEVLARLRALIRRSGRVTLSGTPVRLTAQEYRLLSYLLHHRGKIVSRTELVEHLYEQDFDRDSNTIEVFVGRLRKKIGNDLIQTTRGLGYSLSEPNAA